MGVDDLGNPDNFFVRVVCAGSVTPHISHSPEKNKINTNGYKRVGVQKVCAGRFETSKLINLNVGDGQHKHIWKLGNAYSG